MTVGNSEDVTQKLTWKLVRCLVNAIRPVLREILLRTLSAAHETCMYMHNEDTFMQPSLSLHSRSHVQIKYITVTCCKACK